MKKNHAITVTAIVAATMLSGCASPNYYGPAASQPYPVMSQPYPAPAQSYPVPSQSYYNAYGVVDSIRVTQASGTDSAMGVGTVIGGVVGGLIGNQVGGGRGRTAATVAGAISGAMVGNQMEQRNNTQLRDAYQVGVRLDNGSYQTLTQDSVADLQVGSRVRIENNHAYRY
jgi:outer membrane lipoprotein SlyB